MAAEELFIWVPGEPVPKARPRATAVKGKPRLYTPVTTKGFETKVAFFAHAAMQTAGLDPLACPVLLDLVFTLPIPKGWSKKRTQKAIDGVIAHTKKPDLDNLEKAVEDGLNGVAYLDDKQVVEVTKRKRYGPVCGVAVKVIALELECAP